MNELRKNKNAKITLVGAGPGGVDLITLRGLRALQAADVVLYDALVDEKLLAEAKPGAKLFFVGKRAGQHYLSQNKIHLLLIKLAFSDGHVVRLKGGDPFVFGRGHEELEMARSFNLPTEIIPGISSALAVPALQEVPLTRRGINHSFWVITGTTKEGTLSSDIALAAQSAATVVILMGMRKLAKITALFSHHGKKETPVMIIQNGARENEKMVLGNISNIERKVTQAQLSNPAVIVIGDVVTLHQQWDQLNLPQSIPSTIQNIAS